ncbi:hypothetical protein B0H13DRAFT_1923725 [Mycena leptocephala]|nr:hypothetical protein B0H13DRAFT_1923725 [Mycena leptocephala]
MHCRLKTKYSHYHQKLGATGHGLVAEGKEGEIKENSDIAHTWDEITKKIPVVSADARLDGKPSHKSTWVDLSVLDRGGQFDSDDDADKLSNLEPLSPSGAASDKNDEDNKNEDDLPRQL